MRAIAFTTLLTLTACQADGDGVPCFFVGTSWRHQRSEGAETCGGDVPNPMILGVAGPGSWVEAEATWTGRVVVLGDLPAGYRLTQQPCRAVLERDQGGVFLSDCGPASRFSESEEPLDGITLSITAPAYSPETAAECGDESAWGEQGFPVDPGPSVGIWCNKYFGTVIRLYDGENNLVSDHFFQFAYYYIFPDDPGDGQFADLGQPEATQVGDVVRVSVPATISPRLARYYTAAWGESFGGALGVYPSAGSYPERSRFDSPLRTGDDLDLSFDWEPGDATSADIVLVHNLLTPIFGLEVSSFGFHPLRLTRDGDAWNVVALDLNEWLDE